MSDSEELQGVVERLLRENNVKVTDLIEPVLQRIAGEFWAAGLIEKAVKESMLVTGIDHSTLAGKLFNACETSLVLYPRENFPKFIEVLKRHDAMKQLAAEMESKFEQASESYFNSLVATHFNLS